MDLTRDWKEWLGFLESKKVDFLIIGAYAVAFHGYPRLTGDLDVLIHPDRENLERLIEALDEFGFASFGFKVEDLSEPGMVVQLGHPPGRIDLLTSISGVDTTEAFESAVEGPLADTSVRYLSLELLLRNKRATGRRKDSQDADQLESLNRTHDS